MSEREIITRNFNIIGLDGALLTIAETVEGKDCLVSITDPSQQTVLTCRLTERQFRALCGLAYSVDFAKEEEDGPSPATKQAA